MKDDDDGALTRAIKVENEGLACGFCLFSSFRRLVEELPRRGVSLQWKVGKARLSISFCWQKKMRRKSVTKVLLGHFQAYFFLCLLYLCFVFKGLKSYYILPKTLLCSYFNVVMVYAILSFYTGVWGTYMIVKPSKKDHLCYYISTDFYIHFHFNAVKMQNWNCNTALMEWACILHRKEMP